MQWSSEASQMTVLGFHKQPYLSHPFKVCVFLELAARERRKVLNGIKGKTKQLKRAAHAFEWWQSNPVKMTYFKKQR